jgi:hypothetical protein
VNSKTHAEKTSAAGTVAGFDFQYYYFLYKLLTLKKGETIGFEVLDDVHTQLNSDHQVLIQVKHTVQTKADGTAANLTELDSDLWKTISNWVAVITDSNDDRASESSQIVFVSKTTFVLVSNKSFNSNNIFLMKLVEFQNGKNDFQDIKTYLSVLYKNTESEETKGHIGLVIELEIERIVQRCKTSLEEKDVNPKEIDNLFNQLDSVVRQDIFNNFSNEKQLIYSFEERRIKFRRYFDIANNPNLKIRKFEGGMPDSLEQQTFIKQLLDIEDLALDEKELIQNFTRYRLMLETNLSIWVSEGVLTSEEIRTFEEEIFRQWETEYRASYRSKNDQEEYVDIAHDILKAMRNKELSISGQKLLSDMSHGGLYSLSNKPIIGWLKGWEEKYK